VNGTPLVTRESAHAVVLEGKGLHSGAAARLRLARAASPAAPFLLGFGGVVGTRRELRVVSTDRSTTVALRDRGGPPARATPATPATPATLATVEHLCAALAGASLHRGVIAEVDGPELPLLDGGAATFADALARLGVAGSAPTLAIARDAEIRIGDSTYELRQGDGVGLAVTVDFDDARISPDARWDGDPADFRERIAPARTFAFEHEIEALMARGLASHVAPASVVVLGPSAIHCAGAPFSADEPARHKLLDLAGDLFLHGGPPLGRIRARRPGHRATHEMVRRALEDGVLVRSDPSRSEVTSV